MIIKGLSNDSHGGSQIVTNCPVFLIRFANQYTIYISSISPFVMYIYIYPYIELIISDVRQYTLDLAAQFLVESHNVQIYNYILHAHVYTPKACYHWTPPHTGLFHEASSSPMAFATVL